jgi:hypothetical protein
MSNKTPFNFVGKFLGTGELEAITFRGAHDGLILPGAAQAR